jgi:esterase
MQLNFQTTGTGPPLLVLHGLFGSLDNWAGIGRRLAPFWQVFSLDLRNHGGSPHSNLFNYDLMAADISEFLQTNGLPRANLLGHSMGGKVAMLFALRHPDQVMKLIVADMAPKAYPPVHRPILDALGALDLSSFERRNQVDDALASAIPQTAVRRFLLKNLATDDHGRLHWRLNLDSIARHYDELTLPIQGDRPFPGPALFIRGGRSDHVLDSDLDPIRRLVLQAHLVTIPEAGHWIHADAPEAFTQAVVDFLR